jgi:hypothetical protein
MRTILARVLTQIPEPRKHGPHYFGAYSSRARALRKKQGLELQKASPRQNPSETGDPVLDSKQRAALRKRWANLIRRVFKTDPLLCPCGGKFRILAFITEPVTLRKIIEHFDRNSRTRDPPNQISLKPPPNEPVCPALTIISTMALRHDSKTIRRPHLFTDSSRRPRSLNDTPTIIPSMKGLPPDSLRLPITFDFSYA